MLIFTPMGIIGLSTLVAVYILFASRIPLEGISLPCMMVLTSGIYFYLMPFLAFEVGGGLEKGFFGMYISSLEWPHFAVWLYTLGATAALIAQRRYLGQHPALPQRIERPANWKIFYFLCALAIAGLGVLAAIGRLNIAGAQDYVTTTSSDNFRFLKLFYTMMITLTLIYLLRNNFGLRSLLVLALVTFIFLKVGFRYRVIMLFFGVFASYMLVHRWKIRTIFVVLGTTAGLFLTNLMVNIRVRGVGLDFTRMADMKIADIFSSFGGEVGPVYVITEMTANPLPDLAYFEPWTVGIARLVPSFIWPNKPVGEYFIHFTRGFTDVRSELAGVAAPQQVEMLLQFGWIGLPFLAFLYFFFAAWLLSRLNRLSREARIAGAALIPIFFGFYMQTRGYFFQTLSDGLFLFGPLFLMHVGAQRRSQHTPRRSPLPGQAGRLA